MKTNRLLLFLSLTYAVTALAVDPPPDGGYPNQNTAEGEDALFSLTTGIDNSALGYHALHDNTTGSDNTAVGDSALAANTLAGGNTAVGSQALLSSTADFNTAVGAFSLQFNTTGNWNTAVGEQALRFNTRGSTNTALGQAAAIGNITGSQNTVVGWDALGRNQHGNNNIALGYEAGKGCHGSNNIMIGNRGLLDDEGAIRIGTRRTHHTATIAGISGVTIADGVGVVIDTNGQLGTINSSARYKEAIKPMAKSSESLLSLEPVTFRYKKELDPKAIPQFGLVAEDVAKVDPDLVARDEKGKPYSVRYEAVNAMLLNEFLKEHRTVTAQGSEIADLKAKLADALIAQCCIDADVPLIARDADYRHFERWCGLKLA